MIIERISTNQIKFTLTSSDLRDRNIKITELAYGTEKTQSLFREMMERASSECGFDAENTPLLIEAVPQAVDSIVIIVTRVKNNEGASDLPGTFTSSLADIDEKFSHLPRARDSARFKQKGLIDNKVEKTKSQHENNIHIYSFGGLDDVENVSSRLIGVFNGTNNLFKYDGRYYLLMENNSPGDSISDDDLDALICEFGQRHVSNNISKHYLMEHGELILKHPVVGRLGLL